MPRDRRMNRMSPRRSVLIGVAALVVVAAVGAIIGPRWYRLAFHPLRYEGLIASNALVTGLDPYLVCAVINAESGFDASEVSGRGAVGLMQVLPATAEEVAREEALPVSVTGSALKVPATNIAVGTRYLSTLLHRYGTSPITLAAYNAGPANADRWIADAAEAGTPFMEAIDFPETRSYVEDVLAQRGVYAQLYPSAFEEGHPVD